MCRSSWLEPVSPRRDGYARAIEVVCSVGLFRSPDADDHVERVALFRLDGEVVALV